MRASSGTRAASWPIAAVWRSRPSASRSDAVDKALRAFGQPTLRAAGRHQPAFELFGAGLQCAGDLRDAFADERQFAALRA